MNTSNLEMKIDVKELLESDLKVLSHLAANAFHETMLENFIFKSCLNCDSFNTEIDQCEKFNAKPPAKTIVYSCGEAWVGKIPF